MERKNIIIICVSLIVIVAIICGTVYLTSVKDTSLSLKENSVTKGDNLTFTLVNSEGNPLVNKNLTVNITSNKNKTKSFNLTTNEKGIAKLKIKLSKGEYTVNAVFSGELLLKSSIIIKKIEIKEKVNVPKVSSSSSYSSRGMYSEDGKEFQNFGEYREYVQSKGSSFYNSHSNWDDDGDGFISQMEVNMHDG